MSGLKSGAGDDLWGDDSDDEDADDEPPESEAEVADAEAQAVDGAEAADAGTGERSTGGSDNGDADRSTTGGDGDPTPSRALESAASSAGGTDASGDSQPYIVRRAVRDKSVQFERDERLTFFVHRDVVEGERDLVNEVESALGRDVPKFDVREAVYRAALRNREDVLAELLKMGYTLDDSD